MDEEEHVAAIRASWIQWFTNATVEQVLEMHQLIAKAIATDADQRIHEEPVLRQAIAMLDDVIRRGVVRNRMSELAEVTSSA